MIKIKKQPGIQEQIKSERKYLYIYMHIHIHICFACFYIFFIFFQCQTISFFYDLFSTQHLTNWADIVVHIRLLGK